MKKQLPPTSLTSKILGKSLLLAQGTLDQAKKYSTLPFSEPKIIIPRTNEKFYTWTHYGIFFPLLPEPHRYLNIMILLGTPGALAFDHDDMTLGDPRNTATFFSSTAALDQHLLKAYIISDETKILENGTQIELGEEVSITGTLPHIHLQGDYHGLHFEFDLDVTDQVSWFIKTPIYDHFSLLAKFKGQLEYRGETTVAEGLCTYEYARAAGAHGIIKKLLPEAYKLPLDFFTYQIINLNETTQLLLTKADILGKPAAYSLHVRHTDRPAEIYTHVEFRVISHQVDDYVSPSGKKMRLPQLFSWMVKDTADQKILEIYAEIDSPFRYGHGIGYASAYTFTGEYLSQPVQGRGYIEYIDVEDQKLFSE
ncbi:hypothetical protein L313_0058 [Acinetobacter haemolyticus CIP 64.3 = MTCC 9819]|uniref:AttH domain-containing protein n=1 Tax=Acinetobacter haemolyticus CIP 64.3 = MTCC 9819 TaxID=1217659 RepID=N9G7R7_ACIHA|nr:DUF6670 family protein [Acinetobacter haemolyticus]ENW15530.1 hypothetical protein F927_03265 [Acinetobacter haemolyticus CIP 64.3 = MTCC 9819]EPR90147.1 hypothetical protein L313_0058 [Acinetobacter haemolyticus CIP 64.3 = MTCC 9819]QXZ26551.1 hypothetical protein I6L22_15520 [Acinetobacter haemolyticus]SPT48747.1 Uncharacterised protein [Acinetobacter haemolyticus]SUU62210.1 Uncharacterised protein [Acinetobacter haemolyticus]